jgi:hypothetical protein
MLKSCHNGKPKNSTKRPRKIKDHGLPCGTECARVPHSEYPVVCHKSCKTLWTCCKHKTIATLLLVKFYIDSRTKRMKIGSITIEQCKLNCLARESIHRLAKENKRRRWKRQKERGKQNKRGWRGNQTIRNINIHRRELAFHHCLETLASSIQC